MFSVPLFALRSNDRLQKLSHKKLVDLLAAAQRFAVDHQNRHRLGAAQRDQFLFILRILSDVFLMI